LKGISAILRLIAQEQWGDSQSMIRVEPGEANGVNAAMKPLFPEERGR
jgi:hypothetical protein